MPTPHPHAPVAVSWECLSNLVADEVFAARLVLRHTGCTPLAAGWAVYFNACRKLVPGSVSPGYAIEHLNGDLFRVRALDGAPWHPGQEHVIHYQARYWAINVTDAPLGCFLVPGDGGAAVDLGDPAIVPFVRHAQRMRGPHDHVPAADAAGRFAHNAALQLLPWSAVGRITPRPLHARWSAAVCRLGQGVALDFPPALAQEAALLRSLLERFPAPRAPRRVVLELGDVPVESAAPHEAYRIEVSSAGARLRGASAHGVFNAVQSLAQLLAADGSLPVGEVTDAPRFAYRGLMLDVARHFASVETVLRLLDCMARYKLNRFHFHLTDDEGWRLAIDALPELTALGAVRGAAGLHGACLPPSFGSGADQASSGSGHYSADDFIAILRHAHARHIEVIPEFNFPGHARAAVMAMRARHDRLLALGDVEGAQRFLLSDPDDASVYESVQLWRDNVVCIALPSVDRFIDVVIAEVVALFARAGVPLHTVHMGGDEVPGGAWLGSPICRAYMRAHGWQDVTRLRADFLQRCRAILARHGLAFAGWDDNAPLAAPGSFQVHVWNNAWGSQQEDLAYRLANAGHRVVLSNANGLYFDLAYEKDPEEPGYYWAGFGALRDTFAFCPLDTGLGRPADAMGNPIGADTLAALVRPDADGARRILGLQGQLWGENLRSPARTEYFAMPRLIALAERAWSSDPGWCHITDARRRDAAIARDWNEFANRLGQRELPRLDRELAYGYRLPPPGAVLHAGAAHANPALPGLALHYTVDGSEPGPGSARYAGPVPLAPGAVFKVAASDTRGRMSRSVAIESKETRHA